LTTANEPKRKRIEYVPPPDEVIDKFARDVCAALAEQRNDPSMMNWEIASGFARFLKVAARIKAKQLTAEAEKAQEDLANNETGATQE
jgi:hypothetical protein